MVNLLVDYFIVLRIITLVQLQVRFGIIFTGQLHANDMVCAGQEDIKTQ